MTTQPHVPGRAITTRTTFSRETFVSIGINAPAERIWSLLTNATDYPKWNSTIVSIEGRIELGQKIKLKSTLDSKRVFNLTVKKFMPPHQLVWGDGQGARVYAISENGGTTRFSMTEKIGGLMFPLYAKMIPPFNEAFEQFARDLKKEAEK